MKYIKRLLISAIAGASICGIYNYTPPIARYLLCQYKDDEIQEYIEENLESIIKNQEEKLGIKYPKRPKIEYMLPGKWRERAADGILGMYKSEEDTVYLNSGLLTHLDPDVGDLITLFLTEGRMGDAFRVFNHELGHYYCDSLAEAAGLGNWPVFEKDMDSEELVGVRLIAEGIAEYIQKKAMGETEDRFQDNEWPKDLEHFWNDHALDNHLIYHGGYHLVKPIIDKYGKLGMLHLMFFHPLKEDLTDLTAYQQRTLEQMKLEYFPLPKWL